MINDPITLLQDVINEQVADGYTFEGTALNIELYDYDQAVDFRAVVVRIVKDGSVEGERFPAGFGIKIVEIDEANRKRLDALIARAQRGEALY